MSNFVALIDADVLRYEVGFGVQRKDEEGNVQINSFESAIDLFEQKIKIICGEAGTELPPILYLTGCKTTCDMMNRNAKRFGGTQVPYVPNFREELAISKGYKDNRAGEKPHHYANLTSYILSTYEHKVAVGMEADDLMSIDRNAWADESTTPIICSRDKDLRITPGWHFGWELANQPQFGPRLIEPIGYLEMKGDKLSGGGLKFFYAQLIMGDRTDNIPGLPKGGPALAYKTLNELNTEQEMYEAIAALYQKKMGDVWETYLKEQSDLLWICQELGADGLPKKKEIGTW